MTTDSQLQKGLDVFQQMKWPMKIKIEFDMAADSSLSNTNIKVVDQTGMFIVAQHLGKVEAQELCSLLNYMQRAIQIQDERIEELNTQKEAADLVTDQPPQVSEPAAEATESATRHETNETGIENYHPSITFKVSGYEKLCPSEVALRYPNGKTFAHIPQSAFVRWKVHYDTMKDVDSGDPEVLAQKKCTICYPHLLT